MAELAVAAGLPHETAFDLAGSRKSLAVGNPGHADLGHDVELAAHPVHEDLQVKLTHAGDDGLAGFLIHRNQERGVLVGQLTEGVGQPVLVGLGVGFHRHGDDRLGEPGRL